MSTQEGKKVMLRHPGALPGRHMGDRQEIIAAAIPCYLPGKQVIIA